MPTRPALPALRLSGLLRAGSRLTGLLLTGLLAAASGVISGPTPARADVRFGGYLESTLNLGVGDCGGGDCRFLNFRNLNVLGVALEATPSDAVEVQAAVDIRNLNFTEIEALDDLGDADRVQPVNFRFRAAWVALYDFLVPRLDLMVGAQRHAWGVADAWVPTDRIDPFDLEDPTRFDRRLSPPSVRLAYTAGPVRLEAAVLPLFVPGALPVESFDITSLGDPQEVFSLAEFRGSGQPSIALTETPTETPAPALENVQTAARVVWDSPIGHLEASWYRGFDSLPQARGEARLTGFQTADRVDLGVPLRYPRLQMVGAAWRGHVGGGVSAWVEAAVLFPEEAALTASQAQLEQLVRLGRLDELPDPLPRMVLQSDEPYPNVVAGLDYAVPDGPYLNLQYLYGFLTERSLGDQHHYGLLGVRWPFLDGRLALDLRGGVEVVDFQTDGLGWLAGGGLTYLHGDAVEVELATTWLGGQERTTLVRFENLSNVRLRVAVRF